MWKQPEYQLISLCSRLNIDSACRQKLLSLLNSPIDWNKVTKASDQQGILPFVYYNLNKPEFKAGVPENLMLIMKNFYDQNLHKNLLFEKELSSLIELTNNENIDIIPIKGFSLIQNLYKNPALRILADIDILIKKNNTQKMCDILDKLGYKEQTREMMGPKHERDPHEIIFIKPLPFNNSLMIELHHAFVPPRPNPINLPGIWERAQKAAIGSKKILYLSEEDNLLSLTLHLRRHTRWLALRHVVDIAESISANHYKLDWVYIEKSARNNKAMMSVYFSFYLAQELLGTAIPLEIIDRFRPNALKAFLIRFAVNKNSFFSLKKYYGTLIRFLLFDNFSGFLVYLWKVSFMERFIANRCFKKTVEA